MSCGSAQLMAIILTLSYPDIYDIDHSSDLV